MDSPTPDFFFWEEVYKYYGVAKIVDEPIGYYNAQLKQTKNK